MTRTALVQLTSSDDPVANLPVASQMIAQAASEGAAFVLTPEVTNCVSSSRIQQSKVLRFEEEDQTLAELCSLAASLGIWVLIGSLAVKTHDKDGRFANRSFLIDRTGAIVARYDKIHMFDVQVSETETYRESAGYRPGDQAVLAKTEFGALGMTICYDVRFPSLYQTLAQAGARILTVPSAFSPVTGASHWHSLLRARAIETGCYVLAPAQTGTHPTSQGRARSTFGHSLAVSPWGEILVDGGTAPGIHIFDLDDTSIDSARCKVPSLKHVRSFKDP